MLGGEIARMRKKNESVGRTALLYITDGKDEANNKGFAMYTKK